MKDATKLYPIGSVVLLSGAQKKIMVTGFYIVSESDSNKIFDYCGCLYPEGLMTSEQNVLFDHSQIAQVFHVGYSDDEEKEFKKKVNEFINKENK